MTAATAAELAELQGLLALAVTRRTELPCAAGRDPETVADELLADIEMPALRPAIDRLAKALNNRSGLIMAKKAKGRGKGRGC